MFQIPFFAASGPYLKALMLGVSTAALVACSHSIDYSGEAAQQSANHVELRLMHTTDLHAYVLGFDYFAATATDAYGLEYTAALIEQARAANPNHILIDNGDLIQGSALGDWVAAQGPGYLAQEVHPVIAALISLNYDVANLGNHEFDFGLDFMQATMAGANFPVISANVFHAESEASSGFQQLTEGDSLSAKQPLVKPYVIKPYQLIDQSGQAHTVQVGFIGFLPPQIMNWNTHHLAGRVAVYDMVDAARYFVPKMQAEGADIIIAIPHSGISHFEDYPLFAEQASLKLAQVEGLDALLFGHQHRVFPGDPAYDNIPGVDNQSGHIYGVPAAQPGYWGSHLGVIDLELRQEHGSWQVVASEVSVPAIGSDTYAPLQEEVAKSHEATVAWLASPVLTLRTPLRNYFAKVRPELSTQIVNQAQREHGLALQRLGVLPDELPVLSAAAPFRNGGQGPDDYTSIDAGVLTLADVKNLYVYPNTVQVVQINGSQLRDWLEMSARVYRQISMQAAQPEALLRDDVASFNFDMIAGVTYEIQPHHPPRFDADGSLINARHHRVYNLRYQGELVSSDDQFLVVTNNYRAGGGGNFPHLDGSTVVYQGRHEIRALLIDYISRLQRRHSTGYSAALDEHWYLALPRGAQPYIHSAASESAQDEASRQRDIEFIETERNGYGRYRILP